MFSNLLACFRHSDRGGCEQEKQRGKGGGGVLVKKRLFSGMPLYDWFILTALVNTQTFITLIGNVMHARTFYWHESFYSVYAATQVQHFYRVRVATAVGKAWRNQLGIKKRRKFNCVRPKIPESWPSKHPPGYLKSQLCEKVQISQSRALLCYLKFWYLYSLNAHLLKPCMKAFADQQIWTVKNGK